MKDQNKPLILVCNDDGITAPGIKATVEVMSTFGQVVVVAPDSPQSGMGHAITINKPLRMIKNNQFGNEIESYQCSGTPADCVKLAVDKVLHRKPDLLVSGINHGSNSSINVIYSGTMSAAMEGAIEGIPSLGFSLLDFSWDADFSAAKVYMEMIIQNVFHHGMPKNTLLSVNIPNVSQEQINGVKVCRQARAKWVEEFDKRQDPSGQDYYWLTGHFEAYDHHQEDTDVWALENGCVSVVPIQYDMTDHQYLDRMKEWSS